jgi:glycine cleavage system aminomethyltransferase T
VVSLKRSALFHLHARSGAVFTDRQGWEMPEKFSSPVAEATQTRAAAGLADISYRPKFDSQARVSRYSWTLSPRHCLTIGDPSLTHPKAAVDVTGAYTNLLLLGPHSRRVMELLTSLDIGEAVLPNLACTETKVAHVHAAVLREDIDHLPAFHLLIPREYSESAWTSILHAGAEFGICSVGLAALELLRA